MAMVINSNTNLSNGHSMNASSQNLSSDASIDELDNIRLREITGKAVSGTLLLLLKWFKRSREFALRNLVGVVLLTVQIF